MHFFTFKQSLQVDNIETKSKPVFKRSVSVVQKNGSLQLKTFEASFEKDMF